MFKFRLISLQPVMGTTVQMTVELMNPEQTNAEIELAKGTRGIFRVEADSRLPAKDAQWVEKDMSKCDTCKYGNIRHFACLDCNDKYSEYIEKEKGTTDV